MNPTEHRSLNSQRTELPTAVQEILKDAHSFSTDRNEHALKRMEELTDDERAVLFDFLFTPKRSTTLQNDFRAEGVPLLILSLVTTLIGGSTFLVSLYMESSPVALTGFFTTCLGLLGAAVLGGHQRSVHSRLMTRLTDVRAVPYLLSAHLNSLGVQRNQIEQALTRLIPKLQKRHRDILSSDHLWVLRTALEQGDCHELRIEILRVLDRIGDESFLPVVRMLSEHAYHLPVRHAANLALPGLIERSKQLKSGEGLLRPIDNPEAHANLLRPAGHPASGAELLLRPLAVSETGDAELPSNQ